MTFLFKLETPDGTAADPPSFRTAVPNWRPGDTIPLGNRPSMQVVEVCGGEPAVIVVEEVGHPTTS
jgi:hypothetical protein